MTEAEIKARLRDAKHRLETAVCICDHPPGCRSINSGCDGDCDCGGPYSHDGLDGRCPLTIAELAHDKALALAGFA